MCRWIKRIILYGRSFYVREFLPCGQAFLPGAATLGMIFAVYLVGAAITPVAGRILDRVGYRRGLMGAAGIVKTGILRPWSTMFPLLSAGWPLWQPASVSARQQHPAMLQGGRNCRFLRYRSLRCVLLLWRIRRLDSSWLFLEANRMVRLCSDHHLYPGAYGSARLSILEKLNNL